VRIKIFTTGGSLDKGYSTRESAFVVQEPRIEEILAEANVTFEYEIESLFRKDSLEIAESGQRLSSIQGKTIVITGAMQPASFKRTDAHFNIGFALAVLQTLPDGVYIAMNGSVFDPHDVGKNMELDRFEDTP